MAKLTIEIDMEDSQESWEALYRRIEQLSEEPAEKPQTVPAAAKPMTYDVLLDPERAFGEVGDFFSVLTSQD
ncbi:MAG TPA: hypothetical protein ENI85_06350 [Deltaproteobacteria bacterium]|nr:hypothetical protein [Deltaproteobacteria bacterium]